MKTSFKTKYLYIKMILGKDEAFGVLKISRFE